MTNSRELFREVIGTIVVLVILAFFGLVATNIAYGQETLSMTVTVPIDTVVKGDPGDSEIVATLTPADLDAEVGWVCDLVGFGDNGDSTHPDTNAIITSNGDVVIIPDWERDANTRTAATNGTLTLGATVTIAIQVGEDRIASGGLEIQFTCRAPGTTTTTPATTSTTGPTTSTTGPTSTSSSIPTGIPSGVGPVGDDMPWQMTALAIVAVTVLGGLAFREWLHHGNRNE